MENTHYKRQWRELEDATKKKISAAASGKPKSELHKQHISQSMTQYWAQVPNRPQSGITMAELIGAKDTAYQGGESGFSSTTNNNRKEKNTNELC